MHPFFPVVSIVFNTMGCGMTWYLYIHVLTDPILRDHRSMFEVPIGFAFFFGLVLAIWLSTRKIFHPLLIALAEGAVTGFLIHQGIRFF